MPQKTFVAQDLNTLDESVNEFRKPLEEQGHQIFSQSDFKLIPDEEFQHRRIRLHKTTLMWTPKTSIMSDNTKPRPINTGTPVTLEAGSGWVNNPGIISVSWKDGNKTPINEKDLENIGQGTWQWGDDEGNRFIVKQVISDNKRSPKYRFYHA